MDTILSREILTKDDFVTKEEGKDPLGGYLFDQHPGYQKPEPAEPKGEPVKRDNQGKREHKRGGKGGAGKQRYNAHDQEDVKEAAARRQRQENEKREQGKNAKNED